MLNIYFFYLIMVMEYIINIIATKPYKYISDF